MRSVLLFLIKYSIQPRFSIKKLVSKQKNVFRFHRAFDFTRHKNLTLRCYVQIRATLPAFGAADIVYTFQRFASRQRNWFAAEMEQIIQNANSTRQIQKLSNALLRFDKEIYSFAEHYMHFNQIQTREKAK